MAIENPCPAIFSMQCELEKGHEGRHKNRLDGEWSDSAVLPGQGGFRVMPYPPENPDSVMVLLPTGNGSFFSFRMHNAKVVDQVVTAILKIKNDVFGPPH